MVALWSIIEGKCLIVHERGVKLNPHRLSEILQRPFEKLTIKSLTVGILLETIQGLQIRTNITQS